MYKNSNTEFTWDNRKSFHNWKLELKKSGLEFNIKLLRSSQDELVNIWNGLGASGDKFNFLIPDTIYGLDITITSLVHDWDYYHRKEDRLIADNRFLKNMEILINKGSWWLRFLRKRRAKKYYIAVRMFGSKAYATKQ